jgi:ATP-dependent DNA helicase RecG
MTLPARGQPRQDEQPLAGVPVDPVDPVDPLDPLGVEALIARLRTSRPYAFKDLDRPGAPHRAKATVTSKNPPTTGSSEPTPHTHPRYSTHP